jgi:transglutaminase-like putative cysteine protease
MFFRRIIYSLVFIPLFLLLNLILSTSVYAADDFATSYDVNYDVGSNGITTVTEKVTLKNLTSQYYATQFSLTIGATQISDVSASDASGPLEVTQEQKGTSTTLNVKFNQQIAGEGKELPWTLKFNSKDFASAQGKVWEVSVPKIVSSANLQRYDVTLSVPSSFGTPTSISPTPKKVSSDNGKTYLTFDKDQLQNSGVSANFGDKQLFDFDLSYHLENPGIVPILTNIALPPDTAYQDVIFQRIEPKPINVTLDNDGNYLAWYRLNRNQKLDIKVIGSARLLTNSKVKTPVLSEDLRKKYLVSDKYWDSENPTIKTKLTEILGTSSPTSNTEKAKLIHRWVASNLKYDQSRLDGSNIERLGAVTALNNPNSAVCMEFTDLFIALARAAGIPARENDGFAYTANATLRPLSLNKDILHSWPEYYDDTKGWVMIDPTWESTTGGVDYFDKLDLNHFTFVVKGLSSENPAPAGSYKYIDQDSKDVKVNFADTDFLGKPQIDVTFDNQNPIVSGLPGKIKVRVSNNGNSLQQSSALTVKASVLSILDGESQNLGPIPAFGYGEFEYNIRTKSLIDSFDDKIEVMVANQKFSKDVQIRPFIIFKSFPFVLGGVIAAIASIYFIILGAFIYRRRFLKRKTAKK